MNYFDKEELDAFERIYAAVQRVKLNIIAHDKIFEADTAHPSIDFIQLAYRALKNDFVSHAINVFDCTKGVRSFWWLYKRKKQDIDGYVEENSLDWNLLEEVSGKLKTIRNGTHHHFSHQYVDDYSRTWKVANLKGDDLINTMDVLWEMLSFLNHKHFGEVLRFPDYDGEDAKRCAEYISK